MATINLVRAHKLSFEQASTKAMVWMFTCKKDYALQTEYIKGDGTDRVQFSRKGLSGELTITDTQFELTLKLGFLFSAYKKRIEDQINANMDEQLG